MKIAEQIISMCEDSESDGKKLHQEFLKLLDEYKKKFKNSEGDSDEAKELRKKLTAIKLEVNKLDLEHCETELKSAKKRRSRSSIQSFTNDVEYLKKEISNSEHAMDYLLKLK